MHIEIDMQTAAGGRATAPDGMPEDELEEAARSMAGQGR
jgi:hypothetical protein